MKSVSKRSETAMKRSKTVMQTVKERWTVRDVGRLGNFETERSNASKRIPESVHAHFAKLKDKLYSATYGLSTASSLADKRQAHNGLSFFKYFIILRLCG